MAASSSVARGYAAKKWFPWVWDIGAAGTGAGTGTLVGIGSLGTSAKTMPIGGLTMIADNATFGIFIPDLSEVDLTQAIAFDYYYYFGLLASGTEGITSITTTAIDFDPDRATSDGVSTDVATLTLTGTVARAYAATDICNIRNIGTKTLAAASLTVQTHGLIIKNVIDVAGTDNAGSDLTYLGVMMKYTKL
jgi:hypothetical protein